MTDFEAKQTALETVYKLGYALDALNYHDLAELFHPDKKFNFDIFAILKKPAEDVTPAQYFDIAINGLGGFDATQHVLTNPIVTLGDSGKAHAHVKIMVTAFHALATDAGGVDGATVRVLWQIDLEHDGDKWLVVKWVIQGLMPIDRPDVFHKGHERAHEGKLRASIVKP